MLGGETHLKSLAKEERWKKSEKLLATSCRKITSTSVPQKKSHLPKTVIEKFRSQQLKATKLIIFDPIELQFV